MRWADQVRLVLVFEWLVLADKSYRRPRHRRLETDRSEGGEVHVLLWSWHGALRRIRIAMPHTAFQFEFASRSRGLLAPSA